MMITLSLSLFFSKRMNMIPHTERERDREAKNQQSTPSGEQSLSRTDKRCSSSQTSEVLQHARVPTAQGMVVMHERCRVSSCWSYGELEKKRQRKRINEGLLSTRLCSMTIQRKGFNERIEAKDLAMQLDQGGREKEQRAKQHSNSTCRSPEGKHCSISRRLTNERSTHLCWNVILMRCILRYPCKRDANRARIASVITNGSHMSLFGFDGMKWEIDELFSRRSFPMHMIRQFRLKEN